MASNTSLYSRISPRRPKPPPPPKAVRGFLALPGEIRNRIYSYHFAERYRCELVAEGRSLAWPSRMTVTHWEIPSNRNHFDYWPPEMFPRPRTVRSSKMLGSKNAPMGWPESLCYLMLACKQIYSETMPLLYLNTHFISNSPKRLNNFLSVVPTANLAWIASLDLYYEVYGEPSNAADRIWLKKHNASWKEICGTKKLTGLRKLEIWITADCEFQDRSLDEQRWMEPILQFRQLESLQSCTIHVRVPYGSYHRYRSFGDWQKWVS